MPMEHATVPADAQCAMAFDFDRELVRGLPEMERFARRLTRDPSEAEDLVQDCLERALRNREKFEPGTNLPAWLTTIMKNLHFTKCSRERRVSHTELAEDTVTSAPAQDWQVMLNEVGEALEHLTPDHRRLIRMVAIDGVSYQDAAGTLHVSIGTIRSRLSRARVQLRTGRQPAQARVEASERKTAPSAPRTAPVSQPPPVQPVARTSPLTPGPAPRRLPSAPARHRPAKSHPTARAGVGRPAVRAGQRCPVPRLSPGPRAGDRLFGADRRLPQRPRWFGRWFGQPPEWSRSPRAPPAMRRTHRWQTHQSWDSDDHQDPPFDLRGACRHGRGTGVPR